MIFSLEQYERWLVYRDNRNNTAHDYGKKFAEVTLELLSDFIKDAQALAVAIRTHVQKVDDND